VTLAVTVVKNVEFDPNGHSLSLDGAAPEFVPALFGYEQLTRRAGLSAGVHRLSVSGVAAHCAASLPSPIAFAVAAGSATQSAGDEDPAERCAPDQRVGGLGEEQALCGGRHRTGPPLNAY